MPIPSSPFASRRPVWSSGILCLSLLTLLPGVLATSAAAQSVPVTKVAQETLSKFDSWDSNHDSVLSEAEIDALITSPKITGETAATAAALKIAVRSKKFNVPPITREYLARFDSYTAKQPKRSRMSLAAPSALDEASGDTLTAPVKPEGGATEKKPLSEFAPMEQFRRLNLQRIRRAKAAAFTGVPQLSTVHQGQLGDCYFLAVLGGLLNRDPAQVHQMIVPSPGGGFDVRFPAGQKTHVAALTDGEIALSSSAGDSGQWVSIFEAAFGHVRNEIRRPGTTVAIPTDAIRDGGSVQGTMQTLTGHTARRYLLRKVSEKEMPPAERNAARLPVLREAITTALKDKRLMGASTNRSDLPPGISPNHAYTILDFDAATDTVKLWNPHGNRFTPKGTPGLTSGYPTKNGVFSVPLPELVRIFAAVTVESAPTNSEPPPASKPTVSAARA